MSSDEDERKKRSFDEMFGGDSDDSDDERITSNVGNKKSVTADASGLFGSDSEVSDDEEQEKKKTTTTKIKPSKQKKEETKKNEISRLRRDGKDDDSDQDTATSGRPQQEEEEEEEDDFIDKEDDLADVLGEYNQDRQEFDDERAPDGGEYDDDDEEQEGRGRKPFKETDFFDETLKSLKTHRGRTKMNLSVQDMEQITQELLYRMDKAQQDDQKSIQEGKPALEKLKCIDIALRLMRKVQFQSMLLDFDLLSIVKKWIQPLENGSLPSLNIRSKMLLMISKMPVYKEHLKRSGFGKIVMLLLKHPDETKENKEICRHLIERWSRAVFNKTLDYSKLAELEAEKIENIGGNGNYPSRKKSSFSSTNASASTKSTVSSRVQSSVDLFTNKKRFGEEFDQQEKTINPSDRARLPQQLSFDFLHRPQPKVDISNVSAKKMDNDSRKGRLLKRMQEIAKPGRKGKRSINVSIEGR